MLNRTLAKEKAKTLLRQRSFADYLGYGIVTVCFAVTSGGGIGLTILGILAMIGGSAINRAVSSLSFGMVSSTAGGVAVILLGCLLLVLSIGFPLIKLLMHAGVIRSSLRLSRGDEQVRIADIVMAGDVFGEFIQIYLWKGLFLFFWNLPGSIAETLGMWLAAGQSTAGSVFGMILVVAGICWSIYITYNKTCQYYFAEYICVDDPKTGALECIHESGRIMEGHIRELFVTMLQLLGWNLASKVLFVGMYATPYQYLTYAGIYEQLIGTYQDVPADKKVWKYNGREVRVSAKVDVNASIGILSGEYKGMTFEIKNGETLNIGRDPQRANVVVSPANNAISGLHCSISFDAGTNHYIVTDYSHNGTFVEGQGPLDRNIPTALGRGERIILANDAMKIRLN